MGQAATTDWLQPAAIMNPSDSLGGDINPQQNPYLPLTGPPDTSQAHAQQPAIPPHLKHQPTRSSNLKRQITDQLLAPSDILEYDRPSKKSKENPGLVSEGMDKRHPSSFQQLEKVPACLLTYEDHSLILLVAGRGNICNSTALLQTCRPPHIADIFSRSSKGVTAKQANWSP